MRQLIVIGLGTRDRPKMLERVLESLVHLKLPENVDVELILCENGQPEVAEKVLQNFIEKLPFRSTYIKESSIGIVFMRNRILDEAIRREANFLAFLDDDEAADSYWLIELNKTMTKFSADVVQGQVNQQFPDVANLEILKKFFPGKFNKKTGDELVTAYTNNVLFSLSKVQEHKLKFNERFNLTGGSDSLFFSQLKEKGARIVFSKDAIVTESIPTSRANIEWILHRSYRNGYARHMINIERLGKIRAFLNELKIFGGALRYSLMNKKTEGITMNDKDISFHKKRLHKKGKLDAMMGVPFTEYHVTHGG